MIGMKKSFKNRSAVSPVIATILMVAITVVLAAVLYVMVMGFGGEDNQSLTGTFTSTTKTGDLVEKVQFGTVTPTSETTAINIMVDDGTNQYIYEYTGGDYAYTGTLTTDPTVHYVDLNSDTTIASGDYIEITGTAGTDYTVYMLNAETGAELDSVTFSL